MWAAEFSDPAIPSANDTHALRIRLSTPHGVRIVIVFLHRMVIIIASLRKCFITSPTAPSA